CIPDRGPGERVHLRHDSCGTLARSNTPCPSKPGAKASGEDRDGSGGGGLATCGLGRFTASSVVRDLVPVRTRRSAMPILSGKVEVLVYSSGGTGCSPKGRFPYRRGLIVW